MSATVTVPVRPVQVPGVQPIFPLFGQSFDLESFDPLGTKNAINEGASSFVDNVVSFFKGEFDSPKFRTPSPEPSSSSPSPNAGGSPPATPPKDNRKPIKPSDFKTAAKIGAAGAATAGTIALVNEATKPAIENFGKAFDNASKTVGEAMSPILDPLGIKDPEAQQNIGKLMLLGFGLLAIAGIILVVVKK